MGHFKETVYIWFIQLTYFPHSLRDLNTSSGKPNSQKKRMLQFWQQKPVLDTEP